MLADGGRAARTASGLLAVTAATAVLATGCGGGSSKAQQAPVTVTGTLPVATTPAQTTTAGVPPKAGPTHAYEVHMQKLGAQVGDAIHAIGNVIVANRAVASKQRVIRQLRKLQGVLRTAAAELAAITPPAKVRKQHELLTRGVREYADELTRVIAKVKTANDTGQALAAIYTLKGIKDMTTASHAMTKAGFDIGA